MMKNSNTKYNNKKYSSTFKIVAFFFYTIPIIVCGYLFYFILKYPLSPAGLFTTVGQKVFYCIPIVILLLFTLSALIGLILGYFKGKVHILKEEDSIKKANPYIYYRELPNDFGIGVNSLLVDSEIENYKDIVAVILDLCAKKYIKLVKKDGAYCVTIINNNESELLSNEKYIFSLLVNNNIKNINYQEWFNYCLEDGKKLDLFFHNNLKNNDDKDSLTDYSKKQKQKQKHFCAILIISVLIFILEIFLGKFINALYGFVFTFIFLYFVLYVFKIISNAFFGIILIGKGQHDGIYAEELNNHLTRTKNGIMEYHKLVSFQKFIAEFSDFANKKPDEVKLWDRYLSYAQIFGLTKEIMNSGYKELIENSSFVIDDINNINLNNIEISKL